MQETGGARTERMLRLLPESLPIALFIEGAGMYLAEGLAVVLISGPLVGS